MRKRRRGSDAQPFVLSGEVTRAEWYQSFSLDEIYKFGTPTAKTFPALNNKLKFFLSATKRKESILIEHRGVSVCVCVCVCVCVFIIKKECYGILAKFYRQICSVICHCLLLDYLPLPSYNYSRITCFAYVTTTLTVTPSLSIVIHSSI